MFLCRFYVMNSDPAIWGPHFWFTLFTISMTYPLKPTNVTKKKYYDFVQNLPLFIPHEESSKLTAQLLDTYPVSPYLDSRDSFMRWIHFIHNRVNESLNKPTLRYQEALEEYHKHYVVNDTYEYSFWTKDKQSFIFFIVVFILIIIAISWYTRNE